MSKKEIDARYWRNVEIQDTFWRKTFVDFVKPLKAIYRDPVSAGAFLLSMYSDSPATAELMFKQHPDMFGATMPGASSDLLIKIYTGLLSGNCGH